MTSDTVAAPERPRVSTGIADLDNVLDGGLTQHRTYLVEGAPGSGKTTIALQFLLQGAGHGERGLYITLSETAAELREVARSHGWQLNAIELFELVSGDGLDPEGEQSILEPSEVELGETIQGVIECVDRLRPARVVFDSLSEMRLLAQNSLRYRRQILALKQYFSTRECTVLMLEDRTGDSADVQLHSVVHEVAGFHPGHSPMCAVQRSFTLLLRHLAGRRLPSSSIPQRPHTGAGAGAGGVTLA